MTTELILGKMNNSKLARPPNCRYISLDSSTYNELKREKHKNQMRSIK